MVPRGMGKVKRATEFSLRLSTLIRGPLVLLRVGCREHAPLASRGRHAHARTRPTALPGATGSRRLTRRHTGSRRSGQKGTVMRPIIDGERKALMRRIDAASIQFVQLLPRSSWQRITPEAGVSLVTMRCLMGASLHHEPLQRQFPVPGTVFPVALFSKRSGQKRSGKAMTRHLDSIKEQRSAERQYAKLLQECRKVSF